jgi:hypothetical protein
MPNQPNFPIPDDLTPETFCLCLQIPNDPTWVQTFVGLLAQPTYWFNWDRDAAHSGKELAQYWTKLFDDIDWSTMSCCCTTPQIRLNADGSISVSFDGGVTWQTDNSQDPRYTSPQFPPVTGSDALDIRCKAANSIVRQLKDQQIGYSASIGGASTILGMAALLVGLAVLVFATAGLATFLIGAFFELAAALLATTSGAYDALFTDDDWFWILCEVYCKLDSTGQIPASEFINIQSDFDSHFAGNAALTFSSILGAWQLPGLNNAAKIPTGDNLDCSECDACLTCTQVWSIFGASHGTIDAVTETYIECTGTDPGNGNYYVILKTPDVNRCCTVDHTEDVSGSFSLHGWTDCGQPQVEGAPQHTGLGWGTCINYFQAQSGVPFTVRVFFVECP